MIFTNNHSFIPSSLRLSDLRFRISRPSTAAAVAAVRIPFLDSSCGSTKKNDWRWRPKRMSTSELRAEAICDAAFVPLTGPLVCRIARQQCFVGLHGRLVGNASRLRLCQHSTRLSPPEPAPPMGSKRTPFAALGDRIELTFIQVGRQHDGSKNEANGHINRLLVHARQSAPSYFPEQQQPLGLDVFVDESGHAFPNGNSGLFKARNGATSSPFFALKPDDSTIHSRSRRSRTTCCISIRLDTATKTRGH
jgi:hypothetical protein